MLQFIREKAQGMVAAIIVLFLCLTFAVWGVESYLKAASEVIVAKINGESVPLKEYQTAFQRLRQRAQAQLGESFDPVVWTQEATKRQTLDYVVEEHLLAQTVDRARLRITNDQVAGYLRTSPNFQVDGKFSSERYHQVVSMLGFDERGYEAQARKDLAYQQLRAGVLASVFVMPAEVSRVQQLEGQTRTIGYAMVSPTEPSKEVIPEASISPYFEQHKEAYRVEDKVALEYVELKLSDLVPGVVVTKEALEKYYDAHKPEFSVEERRGANHILVTAKPDATADELAAARRKALALKALVMAGKSFEDVAKISSDDIGSRAEGGATGLFGRGVMAPEFEQAVFSMKVGEVSEPVKTSFGYHIIRLNEIKPAHITPLAEAKPELESKVRREIAETQYFETAERFNDTIYEHPDSLKESATQLGMKMQTASPQTRAEITAMFSAGVADAIWQPEVLTQGLASPPVEIGQDRVVALRVTKYEPSHLPKLEAVKAAIIAELQTQRVREAAKTRGTALLARLKKGEAGSTLAIAEKLVWESFKDVPRDDARLNRNVLRAAFRTSLEHPGDKTFLGVESEAGNYAVVQVSELRQPAVAAETTGASHSKITETLSRARALVGWQDFMASLKASAKIETHPESL